jgi:hypothetical protein
MQSRVELGAVAGVDLEPAARDPALIRLRIGDRDVNLLREFVAELDFRPGRPRRGRMPPTCPWLLLPGFRAEAVFAASVLARRLFAASALLRRRAALLPISQ